LPYHITAIHVMMDKAYYIASFGHLSKFIFYSKLFIFFETVIS